MTSGVALDTPPEPSLVGHRSAVIDEAQRDQGMRRGRRLADSGSRGRPQAAASWRAGRGRARAAAVASRVRNRVCSSADHHGGQAPRDRVGGLGVDGRGEEADEERQRGASDRRQAAAARVATDGPARGTSAAMPGSRAPRDRRAAGESLDQPRLGRGPLVGEEREVDRVPRRPVVRGRCAGGACPPRSRRGARWRPATPRCARPSSTRRAARRASRRRGASAASLASVLTAVRCHALPDERPPDFERAGWRGRRSRSACCPRPCQPATMANGSAVPGRLRGERSRDVGVEVGAGADLR